MIIEFEVEGQRLTRTSEAFLVEGSEKFVECMFIFSGDWDKLDKWAVFRRDNDTYEICIIEGKCLIPIECTAIDGEFSVHCVGKENDEQVIATTSEKFLTVIPEGVPRTTYFAQVMNNIKTFSRNMIYVGENEPGTSEGDVKIWINPAEDDNGSDELAEAVTAAQNAANAAEVQANSVKKYKALWFDSVAAMKAEPSLTAGAYVNTAGYYSPNDGGGASYLIRAKQETEIDDGGSIHELQNGLVAELIVENGTVNIKQFGAKGDGVTDDTVAIQNAVNSEYKVLIASGEYNISTYIVLKSNSVLFGSGILYRGSVNKSATNYNRSILLLSNVSNAVIDGLTLKGVANQIPDSPQGHTPASNALSSNLYGITIQTCKNIIIKNVKFDTMYSDFWIYRLDSSVSTENLNDDIVIENCISHRGAGMFVYMCNTKKISISHCIHIPAKVGVNGLHTLYADTNVGEIILNSHYFDGSNSNLAFCPLLISTVHKYKTDFLKTKVYINGGVFYSNGHIWLEHPYMDVYINNTIFHLVGGLIEDGSSQNTSFSARCIVVHSPNVFEDDSEAVTNAYIRLYVNGCSFFRDGKALDKNEYDHFINLNTSDTNSVGDNNWQNYCAEIKNCTIEAGGLLYGGKFPVNFSNCNIETGSLLFIYGNKNNFTNKYSISNSKVKLSNDTSDYSYLVTCRNTNELYIDNVAIDCNGVSRRFIDNDTSPQGGVYGNGVSVYNAADSADIIAANEVKITNSAWNHSTWQI